MGRIAITLRRALASLLLVVLVAVLGAASVAFVSARTLLQPRFYKDLLVETDVYGFVHAEGIPLLVGAGFPAGSAVRGGSPALVALLDPAALIEAARAAAPIQWLQESAEGLIDAMVPYFTGGADAFRVEIQFRGGVGAGVEVIRQQLHVADIHHGIVDQVIVPGIQTRIGRAARLPYGVTISAREIEDAIRQVVPAAWVQAQVDHILAELTPYIFGDTETFQVVIALGDRIEVATQVLNGIAAARFRDAIAALPTCTTPLVRGSRPLCRPAGATYEEAVGVLGLSISAEVERAISGQLPDAWRLTEADLRDGLAGGSADSLRLFDDMRALLGNGLVLTESDLRRVLSGTSGEDDALTPFDEARRRIALGRQYLFLAFVLLALLLAAIGFLGSRGWSGRVRWAGVSLVLGGFAVLAGALLLEPWVLGELGRLGNRLNAGAGLDGKREDLMHAFIASMLRRLVTHGVIYLGIGLVFLVGASALRRPPEASPRVHDDE